MTVNKRNCIPVASSVTLYWDTEKKCYYAEARIEVRTDQYKWIDLKEK